MGGSDPGGTAGCAGRRSAFAGLLILLVADAGGFAREVAQVEEAAATHDAAGGDLDLLEARAVEHEHALDADVEAHLADGERAAQAGAVLLDDHALEDLDAILVAFH